MSVCNLCGAFDPASVACAVCDSIICSKCFKGSECPFCKTHINSEAKQKFAQLVSRTHRFCTFCKEYVPLQILDHENECPARTVMCPFCNERMLLPAFKVHLGTHADEILALSEKIREIPPEATHFHGDFASQFICDGPCGLGCEDPKIGGARARCLERPDIDLCMSCFMKHLAEPGRYFDAGLSFSLLHPKSCAPSDTATTHAEELALVSSSPLLEETKTADSVSRILFARQLTTLPAREATDAAPCTRCGTAEPAAGIRWKHGDRSICTACYIELNLRGELDELLLPFHADGAPVLSDTAPFARFGLLLRPEE
eukprot:gnl/Chilomastix_cuspidata/1937.p1 GENE.gnl/Chilomastix_cuspidata/1937~~gnl/Chilomastix_cuspidata/1937.p1  ORF type:complete len:339 (-),score=147.87 gnl/Chilomastix_cuspidata/1937:92-1036(-)